MTDQRHSLPPLALHDVDRTTAEAIRRRAHARLRDERRLLERPLLARWLRVYDRGIEPALVITACVVYLAWAAERTFDLMR